MRSVFSSNNNNYTIPQSGRKMFKRLGGIISRAYALGRKMVCSQKSLRNRNFFENAGHVSFSFCQQRRRQNHAKPAHRVRRSSGQPFTGTTRSAGVGGFGLALAILVGLAKNSDIGSILVGLVLGRIPIYFLSTIVFDLKRKLASPCGLFTNKKVRGG